MTRETKNCLVCGKEFTPCNTCNKNLDEMLQWRRVVCCAEHFSYHLPIISYIRGKISKEEARNDLTQAIELYGEIEFTDNIKFVADEILKVEKKKTKKKEIVVDEIVAEEVVSANEIIE